MQRRGLASAATAAAEASRPRSVVVVGSGVSGLSAAWFVRRQARRHGADVRIQLVSDTPRPGGWVRTDRASGSADHLLEAGPRTLRPVGVVGASTLELVHDLGLAGSVVTASKTSPAAQNRYVLCGGRLNKLPTSLMGMLTSNEPALRGLVRAALMEPFRPRSAQPDETIADFVNRRLGARICDNLVSAVIHGIYAGDVHQLSARSTINFLWEMERKHGSIAGGIAAAAFSALSSSSASAAPDPVAADLMSQIAADPACKQFVDGIQKNASIYSFTNGMQVLTDTLIDRLRADNVEVIQTASVGIRQQSAEPTSHLEVALANGRILLADHVVSAVPASTLSRLLPASRITPLLAHNPAATVAVVNLVYRGDLLPLQGFGYLVPRSERHSTDIIGCIFDSCTLPNQASPAGYTRLTVMMGGPTATFCERFGDPASVDPDVLQQKAVGAVAAHLGIAPTALATSRVSVLRDCIPHYAVGHADRVASVEAFIEQTMPGRLSLVGSSYRGVGVNDCVHTARAAAFHLFGKNAHVLA